MKKLLVAIITLSSFNYTFAAESAISLQNKALKQLESAFVNYNDTYTDIPVVVVALPKQTKVEITNNWLFTITSSKQLTINSAMVKMNNDAIQTPVGLVTKNNKVSFQFAGIDNKKIIPNGYKLLAVTPSLSADNYKDFNNFILQKISVRINWQDSTTYNQTTYDYFMVFGK